MESPSSKPGLGKPEFLGIGAQKCGTTWLADNLRSHPDVFVVPAKELHFWNARRHLGFPWYVDQFAAATPGQARGEITPAYGILAGDVVAEIAQVLPDVRLIYLVRNPIDRAWSAALMALGRAEMTIEEASDAWFLDHFRSEGSRRRSDFEACLRTWGEHFPSTAVFVGRFEQVEAEPESLLRGVARHLGVDETPFAAPTEISRRRIFAGPGVPLPSTLRAALLDQYGPAIESLETYLGWDLSEWKRGVHAD